MTNKLKYLSWRSSRRRATPKLHNKEALVDICDDHEEELTTSKTETHDQVKEQHLKVMKKLIGQKHNRIQ